MGMVTMYRCCCKEVYGVVVRRYIHILTGCNLLCQSCIALIATHYRIV